MCFASNQLLILILSPETLFMTSVSKGHASVKGKAVICQVSVKSLTPWVWTTIQGHTVRQNCNTVCTNRGREKFVIECYVSAEVADFVRYLFLIAQQLVRE